jgi:hypothetical protein
VWKCLRLFLAALGVMTSAWWKMRSIMAEATAWSPHKINSGNHRSHWARFLGSSEISWQDHPGHTPDGSWQRFPEPSRGSGPAHAFREHRGRHPRLLLQQGPDRRLDGTDPGVPRRPHVSQRALRTDRLRHRVPGYPQPRRYDLIDSPSARCKRRISARCSAVLSTQPQDCR